MSYKLIKNICINKEDLTTVDPDEMITIKKGDFSFSGYPILMNNNNNVAQVIEGEDMTYAVLLGIDCWQSTNNYNVIVFQDQDWSINNYTEELEYEISGAEDIVEHLTRYYYSLKESFKSFEVEHSSIPSAPNTSSFRATVSGDIKVAKKYTYHGEYNSRKYIPIGMKIGSGIAYDTSVLIQALAKVATHFAADRISNAASFSSSGTNFKTIALEVS